MTDEQIQAVVHMIDLQRRTDMTKTLTNFEQQIAIDKAMEALIPLVQASADSGVSAQTCQTAYHAYQILNKAFVALAKERDAEMKRKWKASK